MNFEKDFIKIKNMVDLEIKKEKTKIRKLYKMFDIKETLYINMLMGDISKKNRMNNAIIKYLDDEINKLMGVKNEK